MEQLDDDIHSSQANINAQSYIKKKLKEAAADRAAGLHNSQLTNKIIEGKKKIKTEKCMHDV